MLSREEMRQVERSLVNHEQDTRDEIGFLLIHQGFADRFFPGTSVLHTRIRYALFVPWIYQRAASSRRRGSDLDATIRRLLIELAIRLKQRGSEPRDVIGGDKLGQLTSQPPDRVYWTALREWRLLCRGVDSRSEALRRLQSHASSSAMDDDGGRIDDDDTEVFTVNKPPAGWEDDTQPLHFKLAKEDREFLRMKLSQVTRPGETALSLLARLVRAGDSFQDSSWRLPEELDARADDMDKLALRVARDAAALAAIGRAVYGALVERLRAADGGPDDSKYRTLLRDHFARFGEAAARCDLDAAETFLPDLPAQVKAAIRATQAYVRQGNPERFSTLQVCYKDVEYKRKLKRARLTDTPFSAQRRAEWDPERHNTTPLHYRWYIVRSMLNDLSVNSGLP